ncbi:phage tail tube protein, partial [Clostridium tertium]
MLRGNKQVSGTFGKLYWNNELIAEVETFEAKVTPKREEVQIDMDIDSKINGFSGEGTFTLKKFYTRGKDKMLEAWKKGEDPRSKFLSKVSDPDATGKQSESVSIDNVWFNELTIAQFEKG